MHSIGLIFILNERTNIQDYKFRYFIHIVCIEIQKHVCRVNGKSDQIGGRVRCAAAVLAYLLIVVMSCHGYVVMLVMSCHGDAVIIEQLS